MQTTGDAYILLVAEVLKFQWWCHALQSIFSVLQRENVYEHPQLVREVADSLMALGHNKYALKYYMMLEGIGEDVRKMSLPFIFACFDSVSGTS